MKFKEEKLIQNGVGKWTVTIDGKEWSEIIKKAKNRIIANLEIPGFRKGKVPAAQSEKYLTPSKIYNEAYKISLSPAFDFARDQNPKILPANSPNPVPKKVGEKEIIIDFVFDLQPEIKIGKYKGINSVKKAEVVVEQKEIDDSIEQYCEQFVMEKTRTEEETVQDGDAVTFDFEGFMDGKAFKGGEAKGHKLIIGSKQFIPGFESSMVGLKLGKSEIEVTFPEDYAPELAGKNATFKLNITEIKERQIPKKDDELIKDLNLPNVNSFKDLEQKIRENILQQKSATAKRDFIDQLIEHIAKDSEIELPKSAIDNQVEKLKKEFEEKLSQQKLNLKKYKEVTGITDEQIEQELRLDAVSTLKHFLVVSEIKKQENFAVSKEDFDNKCKDLANQFGIDVEQIKGLNPEMINTEIINEMLDDFLYSNNG